jgi:hypothetical protein
MSSNNTTTSDPMADLENLIGAYTSESKSSYWLKRWDLGDSACQWKFPERKNGDPVLIREILGGLKIPLSEFSDDSSSSCPSAKALSESETFFEKYVKNSNALVPLCGDSRVVSLLFELGFSATGADLSEKALKNIVAELGGDEKIEWKIFSGEEAENMCGAEAVFFGVSKNSTRGNKICLCAGDFFKIDLSRTLITSFDLIYDRGSLVAILPEMREQYCEKLRAVLKSKKQEEETKNNNKGLFSNVSAGVVGLWLFKRSVRNSKTIGSGPPFHFDVESEIKGKYFKKDFGFQLIELVFEPTKEQLDAAPNGAFLEVMTNIYRMG